MASSHEPSFTRIRAVIDELMQEGEIASPPVVPRLAHVVLNVPDVKAALDFYVGFLGYTVTAVDRQLGVHFLSSGDDHHTLAIGECLPWDLRALVRWPRLVPRLTRLIRARLSGERSATGKRRVRPTLGAIRMALRPGLQHIGLRVASEAELKRIYARLRSRGIRVQWAVNHGDMIKGIYVHDGNGNMVELFVDGSRGREVLDLAKRVGGFHAFQRVTARVGAPDELPSFDLDPETELSEVD